MTAIARRIVARVSVPLLIAFTLPAAARGDATAAKTVARRCLPAVVTIETFDAASKKLGTGSGFVVRPNGVVVTNFHVIEGASAATVSLQNGDTYRVDGVMEIDAEKDFAILKVKAVDLPVLAMANSERLEPGESLVSLGAPKGLSGSVTLGTFSQLRPYEQHRMIQHSASISPGSSGGPLLLENGEVVGVNTMYLKEANDLYFALPINYVRASLDESDGRLVSLAALAKAVEEQTTKAKRENAERTYAELFYTYKDPDSLFTVDLPRGWQVQRNVWSDRDGNYHVQLMSHAPDAQFAEAQGWLSAGVRFHFSFVPKGRTWSTANARGWLASLDRTVSGSYARHELVEERVVDLDGARGRCLTVRVLPCMRRCCKPTMSATESP